MVFSKLGGGGVRIEKMVNKSISFDLGKKTTFL